MTTIGRSLRRCLRRTRTSSFHQTAVAIGPSPTTRIASSTLHSTFPSGIKAIREFGSLTGNAAADGTRMFFEWLEKSYGARFEGNPLPMDEPCDGSNTNNNIVVTRDSLELDDLERLFRHEILALRVRGFYPAEAASDLGRELAFEGKTKSAQNWKVSTSRGLESSDVATVGRHPPYNIAVSNNSLDQYFREVRNELRDRRGLLLRSNAGAAATASAEGNGASVYANPSDKEHQHTQNRSSSQPRLWPLDLLRLELDELWPRGAGLARASDTSSAGDESSSSRDANRCMGGGLPRLMVGPTRWKRGLVHVDELAPLDDQKGCFSANVYLQLPYGSNSRNGGNGRTTTTINTNQDDKKDSDSFKKEEQPVMEIWPLGIRSKWDWYRNAPTLSHLTSQDPEGQVVLRKVLGTEHKQQISVSPGDLVLLCVQRPHCAIGFGHEGAGSETSAATGKLQTRVSLQCFLQYNGRDKRLTIDS